MQEQLYLKPLDGELTELKTIAYFDMYKKFTL